MDARLLCFRWHRPWCGRSADGQPRSKPARLLRADVGHSSEAVHFAKADMNIRVPLWRSCTGANIPERVFWMPSKKAVGRRAQRVACISRPVTMVEHVRPGGVASSTASNRGNRAFSSARASRRIGSRAVRRRDWIVRHVATKIRPSRRFTDPGRHMNFPVVALAQGRTYRLCDEV